ncbi:hypothetical protein Emed_002249 [Eimeria media]
MQTVERDDKNWMVHSLSYQVGRDVETATVRKSLKKKGTHACMHASFSLIISFSVLLLLLPPCCCSRIAAAAAHSASCCCFMLLRFDMSYRKVRDQPLDSEFEHMPPAKRDSQLLLLEPLEQRPHHLLPVALNISSFFLPESNDRARHLLLLHATDLLLQLQKQQQQLIRLTG